MSIEVTVLEFKTRPIYCLREKSDLDLARVGLIRLELPLRADIPAENDPIWWFEREDTAPATLAPISGTVVDVAANPRLEPRLRDVGGEEVVLGRLEVTESFDKGGEGLPNRQVDDDLATHDGIIGHVHDLPFGNWLTRPW